MGRDDGSPRRLTAQLEAAWRRKLAESGFVDLEGDDRDAPLSNRGNLHDAGTDSEFGLLQRAESGAEYTDWAQAVSAELGERRTLRRRVWDKHVAGDSMKQIARDMGINFHVARQTVHSISKEFRCVQPSFQQIIRRVDNRVLARMAAALVRGL